jgi:hypothetical protein
VVLEKWKEGCSGWQQSGMGGQEKEIRKLENIYLISSMFRSETKNKQKKKKERKKENL